MKEREGGGGGERREEKESIFVWNPVVRECIRKGLSQPLSLSFSLSHNITVVNHMIYPMHYFYEFS